MPSGRTNNFLWKWAWPSSRDPTIFGIRSNISPKLLELVTSNLVGGFVLGMPSRRTNNFLESERGLGHVTATIFGSTVGYPSDSLASCCDLKQCKLKNGGSGNQCNNSDTFNHLVTILDCKRQMSLCELLYRHSVLWGQQFLTEPSEALAPTLSPRWFQQTSNIPPVPRYVWINAPFYHTQMHHSGEQGHQSLHTHN